MAQQAGQPAMKSTLGLTGVTVNAMALIAPGAFLWITYQLQAAQTIPGGTQSTAMDMWPGIFFALILAFLTAISYSELAKIYPEAGTGSAYYFAEKTFLDKEEAHHQKWARLAKLATGWSAHLFYWVYPGVMVAFMATLITYIAGQFGMDLPVVAQVIIAVLFSVLVGYIAYRGVNGSTMTSIIINVVQLTTLVLFSIGAIVFRVMNPVHTDFTFSGIGDVILPHNFINMLMQATIAILILVGFESCTAFGAEAKNAKRDVPRAVILALVIQGLFAYLFEYFAANYSMSSALAGKTADGLAVTGLDAAAASSAPMGDLIVLIGDAMFGIGFGLMIVTAVTVALAILGTTLSAMNTGVRISYAMAQDSEMPELLGALHGRFATPHTAVWVLVAVSAVIGAFGTVGVPGMMTPVVALTGVTLASNLGTFILYGLTCLWALIAFMGHPQGNPFTHGVIPVLGIVANIMMVATIFGVGFIGGGDATTEGLVAIIFAAIWLAISVVYVLVGNRRTGRQIMQAPPRPAAS